MYYISYTYKKIPAGDGAAELGAVDAPRGLDPVC